MEENSGSLRPGFNDMKFNLPNGTAVLVLGIISIIGCFCYGVLGLVCGIIAMVLSGKDMRLYNSDPAHYTSSSLSNLKAGRICAIIGLILSALYIILLVVVISTIGLEALRHPDQWMHH